MRQSHAREQIRKPRVGTQAVKKRIKIDKQHPHTAFLVRALQPRESLFTVAERSVDTGQVKRLHVLLRVETEQVS